MSLWQVNCFEITFEVWGQTFKMLILTYIFLYSGVFLHLKPTKPGEKNNNAFPYFIFCEPPFNTGEQILQEIFFLSLFFQ